MPSPSPSRAGTESGTDSAESRDGLDYQRPHHPAHSAALRGVFQLLQDDGRFDEAIEHYQVVLKARPDFEPVLKSLNIAKEQLGKNVALLEQSLERNPNQPELQNQLSVLYWQKGELEKALSHWEQSVSLKSDQPLILNNLAWSLSVYPDKDFYDPQEAVKFAEKACKLTAYSDSSLLDTLSISYAAAENFAKAVETVEKALAFDPTNEGMLKRLDSFKDGKAYSEKR